MRSHPLPTAKCSLPSDFILAHFLLESTEDLLRRTQPQQLREKVSVQGLAAYIVFSPLRDSSSRTASISVVIVPISNSLLDHRLKPEMEQQKVVVFLRERKQGAGQENNVLKDHSSPQALALIEGHPPVLAI